MTHRSVGLDSSLLSHPTAELIPSSHALLQFKARLASPVRSQRAAGTPETHQRWGAMEGTAGARALGRGTRETPLCSPWLRCPRRGMRQRGAGGTSTAGGGMQDAAGCLTGRNENKTMICNCKQINSQNRLILMHNTWLLIPFFKCYVFCLFPPHFP